MQDNQKDLTLIDRILSGDQSAYRDLANRHKDYAFTVAYRIIGNREDAEEVAHDAFIQAFRALDKFNREAKFTTWFYRIVFNAAAGFKRKNKIILHSMDTALTEGLGAVDVKDAFKRKDQQQYISLAMQHLPPDDVTMITLFYFQEHTLEEIAEITGIPANTAKVKLHRARKRLGEELKRLLKSEAQTLL